MGRPHFCILLVVVFLIGILDSPVDGYRYFRHGRLGKKLEDSKPSKFERWFTQHLDHFNPNDEREWQQRYFVNDEFFNTTSRNVAFLQIGGEGEATADWMTNGSWYLYAQDFKPILFQLEHRYYGKSHPTEDISTENLVYLTSQQALADLAFFIEAMNEQYELSSDVKWIVFGGSYPGSLAAWMRQKYPHLVHGAMSASGPLLAKLDFPEYLRVVQDALRTSSEECANAVKVGTSQIDTLLLHMVGQRSIDDKFKLCDKIERSIDNPLDVSNFYLSLSDNFAGVVQYNHDNRASTVKLNLTVEKLCSIMTDKSLGNEINRLAAVNSLLLQTSNETCLDYKYDNMLDELRNTSWDAEASEGGRQWTYQTCTEFGFYQTSTYKPQIFGDKFDLDFFVKQCQDIFGPEFNKTFLDNAVERTNVLYGGLDIEVNNVVFVHGSLDPWHVLGITQTENTGAPAILIKGAAHCSNMYNPSDNDTPQLKAARVQIKDFIASWIDL
ncbi:unnamed protein product [Psylliodes chrysocephalus]|uniref:Serine protease K12H4.7 n=1 Tax=Psylliodes chrysocephalus TaxID=3402493 RepID=A0A9P0CIB4_9CUCU|nr:unnamed protein product [Psylliodes chrysocephala]